MDKIQEDNVEDMDLSFEVPGCAIDLLQNGSQRKVTKDTLKEFKDALLDWYMYKSIQPQVIAFRRGFNQV